MYEPARNSSEGPVTPRQTPQGFSGRGLSSTFSLLMQTFEPLLVWIPHRKGGTFCQSTCLSVEALLSIKLGCVFSHVSFCSAVRRKWLVHRNETFSKTVNKSGPQIERFKGCSGKCCLGNRKGEKHTWEPKNWKEEISKWRVEKMKPQWLKHIRETDDGAAGRRVEFWRLRSEAGR